MSKFSVSVEFDNLDVAIRASELLSVAFPMLSFQIFELPELDLSISDELKLDLEMSSHSYSLKNVHSDSLCNSCKKVHKNANMELNCEGCPNATV